MFERTWTKLAYRSVETMLFVGGAVLLCHEAAHETKQMSPDGRSISNASRIEGLEAMALMAGSLGMMMGERIVSTRAQNSAEQTDRVRMADATAISEHEVTQADTETPRLKVAA